MISDELTFFLAFLAVFLGFGAYLWLLEGRTRILEDRIAIMEAASSTNPKSDDGDPGPSDEP